VSGIGRAAWLRAAGAILLCLAGIATASSVERRSEQRANRLHRNGDFTGAARLYTDHARAESVPTRVRYNLGTTLSELGSPSAAAELETVVTGPEAELRARALYNLGRLHLVRAREATASDSARADAGRSVDANKLALRLEPGRADARWNLALAQRMLDSMNAESGRAGTESVDGAADSDERVLSDELREFEDDSEVDDAPREGSDEALAQADESAPLSAIEAGEILSAGVDRSIIVRKLLTYEGRVQRRVRVGRAAPRW
jgi:hypothetical protein